MDSPFGGALLSATIKAGRDDFLVEELLPFEPTGSGPHVWVRIAHYGLNTADVARRLARLAGVSPREAGFAGLKDRWGLTTQHFTVHLPKGPEPDWRSLEGDHLRVLDIRRHGRKLQRGALRGNRFRLRLRSVEGPAEEMETRLGAIAARGFPNYFGEQRFGREGGNLAKAAALLRGRRFPREERGILLSSARSALFNAVLAWRVRDGSWERVLPGEIVMLAGSRSRFLARDGDLPTLQSRVEMFDIHPSGPLAGSSGLLPEGEAREAEEGALAAWRGPEPFADAGGAWAQALSAAGLEADRRPLRVRAEGLHWTWHDRDLELDFSLPAGSYATSLLAAALGQPAQATNG